MYVFVFITHQNSCKVICEYLEVKVFLPLSNSRLENHNQLEFVIVQDFFICNKMNLNCGAKTIKYLILTFNFLFLLSGIILVGVGASIKAYYTQYNLFLDDKYFTLPNLLIATGTLIFIISFLGCYGAMKESWILLLAYSFLLGIIFIFEFSAGIAGYVLRNKTSAYLETTMKENMKIYGNDTYDGITKTWDIIQSEFQCCGVTNLTDWQYISELKDNKLPVSCCPSKYGTTGDFSCYANNDKLATTTILPFENAPPSAPSTPQPTVGPTAANSTTPPYEVGCKVAFGNFVKTHAVDIGGVGFALAVIQMIGVGFSCYLSRRLKNSYYST